MSRSKKGSDEKLARALKENLRKRKGKKNGNNA